MSEANAPAFRPLGVNRALTNNAADMHNQWEIDADSLSRLLAWLHPEPQQAGVKYEEIRRKLIKIFASRGCPVAEDLADTTVDRVCKKVEAIAPHYEGDPSLYFFGVGNRVFLEWSRRPLTPLPPPPLTSSTTEKEQEDHCLQHCLKQRKPAEQSLLIEYYSKDKSDKIEQRKALARQLGLSDNALKIKVFRLRNALYECLKDCLEKERLK